MKFVRIAWEDAIVGTFTVTRMRKIENAKVYILKLIFPKVKLC
jgi:hypothetical protein